MKKGECRRTFDGVFDSNPSIHHALNFIPCLLDGLSDSPPQLANLEFQRRGRIKEDNFGVRFGVYRELSIWASSVPEKVYICEIHTFFTLSGSEERETAVAAIAAVDAEANALHGWTQIVNRQLP